MAENELQIGQNAGKAKGVRAGRKRTELTAEQRLAKLTQRRAGRRINATGSGAGAEDDATQATLVAPSPAADAEPTLIPAAKAAAPAIAPSAPAAAAVPPSPLVATKPIAEPQGAAPLPPGVEKPPAPSPAAPPVASPAPETKPGRTGAWAASIAAIEVKPVVSPARLRRRHWGLVASLIGLVVLPLIVTAAYLWMRAQDQYASTVGFTVRQEENASAGVLAGGLAQVLGGSGTAGANARLLYEYIQSQELVASIQKDMDLIGHYTRNWQTDPVYAIKPDARIEEMTAFWLRMVRISYDEGSGLIEVEVRALDPNYAQAVAKRIVEESQTMINQLNVIARRDSMAWALTDLEQSIARLRTAREALTTFRATTQILDPAADIQGRMGILTSLQGQLAQSLVDLDLLSGADENDPRRLQMLRRIEVIRDRIVQERQNFAAQDVTISGTDYPTLLARYESLLVDLEVADITYRAAQAAHEGAKSRAERQTLYLATYIRPTLAQKSEYPDRPILTLLAGFFLLMLWSVLALVYYSLRDRG